MALKRIEQYIDAERQAFLDRCTACGKCVAVCPMLPFLEIKDVPPDTTARGLLSLLRGQHDPTAATFADACSGSAKCRGICPENLDPYTFMRLAKLDVQLARLGRHKLNAPSTG